jgi:UDP-N-acetylglucosamine 3-dehydrogenase
MALDEDAAIEFEAEAQRRGQLLAVGLVERCNPAVQALQLLLDEGTAGRIHQVHARRLSPYPGRESPTGVALDLATHDLDVIRFITRSEYARVYAETASYGEDKSREDMVCASLGLDSGAIGMVDVNWMTPTKVRQLSVTCEGGMFVVDYLTQDITFHQHPRSDIEWDVLRMLRGTGEGDMLRYGIARREPLAVQWDLFLAALEGRGEPAATGHDGLAALSTARAIQRSGAEHSTIVPTYRMLTVA